MNHDRHSKLEINLVSQCRRRNIDLKLMPKKMERHRLNTTRYIMKYVHSTALSYCWFS